MSAFSLRSAYAESVARALVAAIREDTQDGHMLNGGPVVKVMEDIYEVSATVREI